MIGGRESDHMAVDVVDVESDGSSSRKQPNEESKKEAVRESECAQEDFSSINVTQSPKGTLGQIEDIGIAKAKTSVDILMAESILAGFLVAGGSQGFVSVGGGLVGATLFSTGLYAVVFTGADLFTSDSLYMLVCVLRGTVSVARVLRNWTITWLCNFAGVLLWVAVLTYASNTLHDVGQVDFAVELAEKKAFQPWGTLFAQGIGANFFVCLAIFQSSCARHASGKVLAIYFPVVCFALSGYQHSVANMYFITAGMLEGADVTIVRLLFQALLPATLGNILGGGFVLGGLLWYCYDDAAEQMRMKSMLSQQ